MEWKFDPQDHWFRGGIQAFEHRGVPVVIRRMGTYAEAHSEGQSTRDVPSLLIMIGGGYRSSNGQMFSYYDGYVVQARVGHRTLHVAEAKTGEAATPDDAIGAAVLHLDAASNRLAGLDAEYAAASAYLAPICAETDPLGRVEYEAECRRYGLVPRSDQECDSYGVRYGDFRFPEYAPEVVAATYLDRRRLMALDAERAAVRPPVSTAITLSKMEGQLWEGCERCGAEPVYMPLHLCAQCWPKPAASS